MNPDGLIDRVILDYDGLNPDGAEQVNLRASYLSKLQRVYDYVWSYRDWEFTYTEDSSLQIAASANNVALPTNYADLGSHGSLFDEDRKVPFQESDRRVIEHLRRRSSSGVNLNMFGIWEGKIQIPYTATSTINLVLFYLRRAETLGDDPTAMLMPDRYSDVILHGLLFHTQSGKNDARQLWGGLFREGLARMCRELNPAKTAGRRVPLAVRRAW